MYQISDVTPVVLKPEDIKTVDLKRLPPGISDVPAVKHKHLESLGSESFVDPQITVEPVENSIEIKIEELRCNYETNRMNPESTAAKGGTGKVKTESADEGDNTSNLVIESVTSLNSAVTTVDHLLTMKEDVLQTPTLVKTEVEEISVKDEFSDTKSEAAILPSVEINPHTNDESAAATSASGRPRRSVKRINYSEYNDVGREANDQILMPKKTGEKGGRKPKRTTEDLARNSTMKPKFEKSPATGKVSSNQTTTCVDINEVNKEDISTQDTDDEDDQDWRMNNNTDLVRNTSGISSTMRNKTRVDSLEPLTGEKPFICTVCNSKFVKLDTLKNHMRTHTGEKPYACTQCDFRSATQGRLTSHTKIHLGDKKHKCPHCDYKSVRLDSLKKHLRTHTGEKPYLCTSCDYRSSVKGSLLRHIRVHTGEKAYSCTSCDYRSSGKGLLVQHMRVHTGEKPYSCTSCEYRSSQKGNLLKHMRVHTGEKPYSCTSCEYRSSQKNQLLQHMRVHTGKKPYSCTSCDYRSSQKGNLLKHMRVHTGEKPYSCTSCDYRSSDKGALLQHMRVHTGEKPYSCTSCDYRSSQKGHLLQHMRVHTGEKPHACPHCPYRALDSSMLKRHVFRIHNGIKKYNCEAEGCDYRASTSSSLNAHMETHRMNKRNRNKPIRISVVPQPPAITTTLTCYSCQFETPSRQKMKSHVLQHLVPVPPETNHVNMN